MNRTPFLSVAALAAVVWLLANSGDISTQAALAHLNNGAAG
jgi:hypothetical protein